MTNHIAALLCLLSVLVLYTGIMYEFGITSITHIWDTINGITQQDTMVLVDFVQKTDISKPLFIDTDFHYELDITKFPGLDDPITKLQPSLLIHNEELCDCKHFTDLQTLLDSCADIECSDSDSVIDDILGDNDAECSNTSFYPSYTDSSYFSNSLPSTPNTSNDPVLEQLLRSVATVSDSFTPDITASLLNVEEDTSEQTTLSDTKNGRKGVKRRLFSDGDLCFPNSKRQHVFGYEEKNVFAILDDLFNH